MFVSRPQIVHGVNVIISKAFSDLRVRGTANLVASNIRTLTAHTSDVLCVAFSDSILATGSSDLTVRLWDTQDFTELPCSPLTGHRYMISCCDFSPLGTILATCSTDGTLRLWNPESGKAIAVLTHPSKCAIKVCAFSSDGSFLVTGGDDDMACLWNVPERKLVRSFKGHEESVAAAAFSPDGNYIVTGSSGGDPCGELLVWDAQYGHGVFLTKVRECHDLGVLCCQFSPVYSRINTSTVNPGNRYVLATGGKDNLIKLWFMDCEVGSSIVKVTLDTMLPGHKDSVLWLRFSPDGRLIASSSLDKTARLWNAETKQALICIEEHSSYVTSCAFSRDSKYLATASNDCKVIIWQLSDTTTIMKNLIGYEEGEKSDADSVDLGQRAPRVKVDFWSIDDVCSWLRSLDFAEHVDKFRVHAIDGKELLALTENDLKSGLGIEAFGHQKKIIRERDALKEASSSSAGTPSRLSDRRKVPEEFLCPITHDIMQEPVIAADGYTYDHSAIVSWISKEHRSPMTNNVLTSKEVIPNRTLRMMIQKYLTDSA